MHQSKFIIGKSFMVTSALDGVWLRRFMLYNESDQSLRPERCFRHVATAGWKAFEFIGEAVPQLILSIVFMANNYEFMIDTETFVGAKEFEVTLTSMVFSIGSILVGLYSGIPILEILF